jgi:hypothetical protein
MLHKQLKPTLDGICGALRTSAIASIGTLLVPSRGSVLFLGRGKEFADLNKGLASGQLLSQLLA